MKRKRIQVYHLSWQRPDFSPYLGDVTSYFATKWLTRVPENNLRTCHLWGLIIPI